MKLGLTDLLNYRVQRLGSKMSLIMMRDVIHGTGLNIAEWRLICTLGDRGPLNLTAISKSMAVDLGRTSRLLKSMEASGLISRNIDPNDRRVSFFDLSEKGREYFERHWPKASEVALDFHRIMSSQELKLLNELLDRAIARADERLNLSNPVNHKKQKN